MQKEHQTAGGSLFEWLKEYDKSFNETMESMNKSISNIEDFFLSFYPATKETPTQHTTKIKKLRVIKGGKEDQRPRSGGCLPMEYPANHKRV